MRDYPILHLDTNKSKGTALYCSSTFHSHSRVLIRITRTLK
jgi:hypothetical protein